MIDDNQDGRLQVSQFSLLREEILVELISKAATFRNLNIIKAGRLSDLHRQDGNYLKLRALWNQRGFELQHAG